MQLRSLTTILAAALGAGCAVTPERDLAWEVKPQMSVRHGMEDAQAQYQLGRYYQGQGRNQLAEKAYRRVLAVDPEHTGANNALASILAADGQLEEAARRFEQLLSRAPASAYLHNNVGYALHLQGRHAEAVAQLQRALALDPGFERAWANLESAARAAGMADVVALAARRGAPSSPPIAVATSHPAPIDAAPLALSHDLPHFPKAGDRMLAATPGEARPGPQPDATPMPTFAREGIAMPIAEVGEPASLAPAVLSTAVVSEAATIVSRSEPMAEQPTLLRVGLTRAHDVVIDARLEISNGNGVRHLAGRVGERLKAAGLDVRRVTNYHSFSLSESRLEYRRGYESQARALAHRLGLDIDVVPGGAERWGSDVRLILGADVAGDNRIRT